MFNIHHGNKHFLNILLKNEFHWGKSPDITIFVQKRSN